VDGAGTASVAGIGSVVASFRFQEAHGASLARASGFGPEPSDMRPGQSRVVRIRSRDVGIEPLALEGFLSMTRSEPSSGSHDFRVSGPLQIGRVGKSIPREVVALRKLYRF